MKAKINWTNTDTILEILAWAILLITWIITCVNYPKLPEIIPTHYNSVGHADDFGTKKSIFILPLIASILVVVLSILNKFPHRFNYPVKITQENSLRQYTLATKLLRYIKLNIAIIFGFISFQTIQIANKKANGLGVWFLIFTIALLFIPILHFMISSWKTKNK
ncbi:MAG: DUF1648 domain-containing protein [Chitinophagaceae bacterium]